MSAMKCLWCDEPILDGQPAWRVDGAMRPNGHAHARCEEEAVRTGRLVKPDDGQPLPTADQAL